MLPRQRQTTQKRAFAPGTLAVLIACVGAAAARATAQSATTPEPPASPGGDPPPTATRPIKTPPAWLRGELRSRYVLRWTGDDSDSDLVETLSLDAGDAATDRLTGHLFGRLTWDLDGSDDTFASINDAYGGRVDALLYDAYVDVHRVGGLSRLRLGRQATMETPELAWFDGAHVTSQELGGLGLLFGAYFGSSVHLYESSKSGDLLGGVYAEARPWTDGRLRVDWMHLEDETRLRTRDDELLGASAWQSFGRYAQLETRYSRIGGKDRDVQARATCRVDEWGFVLRGSFYELLLSQGDLVLEADPFFNAVNELRPYDQWSLVAAKDVDRHLNLQAGGDLRRVHDRGDIGFYNRDYDRWYGTATVSDVGLTGLRFSATLDLWDANAQLARSWGADASYDFGKTSASLGTYWSLYKFDLFSNSERDHVRTWFLRLRHKLQAAVTVDGDYEFEDDDFDQYHRFRLGVTWRF